MTTQVKPQLRLFFPGGGRIGPGKIDLLEAIARTGSIAAGGRELKMSYRRAWLLINALNNLFDGPVVMANTGGVRGGGAEVTELGQTLIASYRRIEQRVGEEADVEFAALMDRLNGGGCG